MVVSYPGFSSLNNPDLNDLIYSLYILNVLISLRSNFDKTHTYKISWHYAIVHNFFKSKTSIFISISGSRIPGVWSV